MNSRLLPVQGLKQGLTRGLLEGAQGKSRRKGFVVDLTRAAEQVRPAEEVRRTSLSRQGVRSVKFGGVTSVIAHRGASRLARENTIEAFHAAIRVGAAGIELDARRTEDGVLVVNHDAHVDGRAVINEFTELKWITVEPSDQQYPI